MEFDSAIFIQGTLVVFSLVFLGGGVTSIGLCNMARSRCWQATSAARRRPHAAMPFH
jgi:hypothetical protein